MPTWVLSAVRGEDFHRSWGLGGKIHALTRDIRAQERDVNSREVGVLYIRTVSSWRRKWLGILGIQEYVERVGVGAVSHEEFGQGAT